MAEYQEFSIVGLDPMSLPVVVIFGVLGLNFRSPGGGSETETRELDCRSYLNDSNLVEILIDNRPDVIVSIGREVDFANLMAAPYDIRRKWINFAQVDDVDAIGASIYNCYLNNALGFVKRQPLVSVFTPAFRTGNRIQRPFRSLLKQSYTNWEWIVVDDSADDNKTYKELCELSRQDYRIGIFKAHRHSGKIGEVKRQACGIARGDILLELDHDDELTSDAISAIVHAFDQYPAAGFAYTDWAEVFENGQNATYGPLWAFGYGKDRFEFHDGRQYIVHQAPLINSKTIRHIVSAPNHIRSWRRDFYESIGGHSRELAVADDYELCVRTFLKTRMIYVPKFCYIQYYNENGNTQRLRNKDIQRITRHVQVWRDKDIHNRFRELGVDDFVWSGSSTDWSRPNPDIEQHCSLISAV